MAYLNFENAKEIIGWGWVNLSEQKWVNLSERYRIINLYWGDGFIRNYSSVPGSLFRSRLMNTSFS